MVKPVVVGIGELLWDMLPEGKRAGGAPINFVYNATQLGADGYARTRLKQLSSSSSSSSRESTILQYSCLKNPIKGGTW